MDADLTCPTCAGSGSVARLYGVLSPCPACSGGEKQWTGADRLARTFHETYERLAPEFGYETRRQSAMQWEAVPEQNKALMRAVCAEVYPWVCAQLVDLLRADVDHKHLADVEAERDALRAERDQLQEALRPFAAYLDEDDPLAEIPYDTWRQDRLRARAALDAEEGRR